MNARDEIDFAQIEHFALVDHHVSDLLDRVVCVVDHRPIGISQSILDKMWHSHIELVGSCATLITQIYKSSGNAEDPKYADILLLLYGKYLVHNHDCVRIFFSNE